VVTNILLRCAVSPGALDNIKLAKLVQVFELLQNAAGRAGSAARVLRRRTLGPDGRRRCYRRRRW
jgi:hypothetical protein